MKIEDGKKLWTLCSLIISTLTVTALRVSGFFIYYHDRPHIFSKLIFQSPRVAAVVKRRQSWRTLGHQMIICSKTPYSFYHFKKLVKLAKIAPFKSVFHSRRKYTPFL